MRTSSPLGLPLRSGALSAGRWGLALVAVVGPSMGCTDSHLLPDAPSSDTASSDAPSHAASGDTASSDAPALLAMDTAPELDAAPDLDAGVDASEDADLPDGYYSGVRG